LDIDVFDVLFCVNSLDLAEDSGIGLLKQTINNLMKLIDVNMSDYPKLIKVYDEFFEKIKIRIENYSLDDTIEGYKKCYQEKKGVVLSSYHGVKGEEYEVVIAFGMLKGYVPNWNVIFNKKQNENIEAKKLIYVVTSRAKRDIFIIAEKGHIVRNSGNLMEESEQFIANKYKYSDFNNK
jgi:superfamily I DNA/RNA helicase